MSGTSSAKRPAPRTRALRPATHPTHAATCNAASVHSLSRSFLNKYYTMITERSPELQKLYGDDSHFCHGQGVEVSSCERSGRAALAATPRARSRGPRCGGPRRAPNAFHPFLPPRCAVPWRARLRAALEPLAAAANPETALKPRYGVCKERREEKRRKRREERMGR